MIAAIVESTTSGSSAQDGAIMKNGCVAASPLDEQQRPLAEVIDQQRRQDQPEPRQADREASEVPHVRIERLGASHHEDDCAQHGEAVPPVLDEESERMPGVEGATAPRAPGRSI